jgi:hypothetical protein
MLLAELTLEHSEDSAHINHHLSESSGENLADNSNLAGKYFKGGTRALDK